MKKLSLLLKLFTLILFFSSFAIISHAQKNTGNIKGIVHTADDKPASNISIVIDQIKKGAVTDDKGNFSIQKLAPGNYTVKIKAVGVAPQEKEVSVSPGETSEEDFTIDITSQQLQDVIVNTQRAKYTVSSSDDVAKMPLKNIENPQVVSVVNKSLLQDQLNTNITQALNNIPGAVATTDPAGGVSITVRGFTAEPAARNGVPFIAAGRSSLDPINIESIEVLKGPSATLFGNFVSTYGGGVNLVTKKPFDTFKGEVGYSFGSWGLNRVTADINTPLNSDKTALLRVNAAVNKENSFMQTGHNNRYVFDPSLLLKVNDRLTLSFDMELYREDATRTPFLTFGGLPDITNVKQVPIGYTETFYADNFNAIANTVRTYAEAKYKISDHWTSQTNVSVNSEHTNSYQGYPSLYTADSLLRSITLFDVNTTNIDLQHNLQGDFRIGSVRNRVVWGLDYMHYKSTMNYYSANIDNIDINDSYSTISKMQADNAIATHGSSALYPSEWEQYATYLSDLVNVTDNIMALASVRADRYDLKGDGGYKQTSWSPRFGLIYQPIKNLISIFGNYMSGFQNNGPAVNGNTEIFLKPSYARQWEGGVKIDGFHNRLTASLSYYNIDIKDALRYDANGYTYQDGSQKSKGFEADVTANPVDGLNISGGYVYNDNKYIKSTSDDGKEAQYNPKNVANLWISYRFQKNTALNGFGLGFGGNYADKGYYDDLNTIIIPSYTIFNASIFYDRAKWRVGLAMNNIGNKKYWSESFAANPQALRSVTANVTLRF